MISSQDFDRLSAYMDHQLTPRETAALEARLTREPELKAALDDLRATVRLMRALPTLKPPRNFTLTRAQAAARPRFQLLPALRLTTVLASLALALVFVADWWTAGHSAASPTAQVAAPLLASGMAPTPSQEALAITAAGGNAAADMTATPPGPLTTMKLAETETPTPEGGEVTRFAAVAPTDTPVGVAESTVAEATPSADAVLTSAPPTAAPAPDRSLWRYTEIALALMAVMFALAAWRWRQR
jgi:hypothetical protein